MKKILPGILAMAALTLTTDALAHDPNCTVNVAANGAINNYYGAPTAAQKDDAVSVNNALDFADIWRNAGTLHNSTRVRLDAQGPTAQWANLQDQINNVQGHSTIAHVQVAQTLAGASTPERQQFVRRKTVGALMESLHTGNRYDVTGNCN